jgi:inosine-uridine nucleoside N-ribohydrolase
MPPKIIVITDIGYDPDDMFAIAYLISRGVRPDLIMTSDEVFPFRRACLARYVLNAWGVFTPVFPGIHLDGKNFISDVTLPDRWDGPQRSIAPIVECVESAEQTTIIGLGGFTEIALFARNRPDLLKRCHLVQMGGALDYSRHDGWVEHNIRIDPAAAQGVLIHGVEQGLKVTLVMSQTTFDGRLQVAAGSRIYYQSRISKNPALQMLAHHCDLFAEEKKCWPMMHDPLTCSVALGETFVEFEEVSLTIDEHGNMKRGSGTPTIRVSKPRCDANRFMMHLESVLFGK